MRICGILFPDLKKHHTCLNLFVLDNCEVFRSKYTPDEIRDDKEVRSFVDDVVKHSLISVRACYGMGKTYKGLRQLIKHYKK